MTTYLPNLSNLKLLESDDPEESETISIGAHLQISPPEDHIQKEDDYRVALYGSTKLKEIARAIEKDKRVLMSADHDYLYKTLDDTMDPLAIGTKRWWWEWYYSLSGRMKKIGEGSWNQAFLVSEQDVQKTLPEVCFQSIYNRKAPSKLIIRIGKVQEEKKSVLREMITAAYAHFYGFGPDIFAQFYITDEREENDFAARSGGRLRMPWNNILVTGSYTGPSVDLNGNNPYSVFTIAEAWDGDCTDKIGTSVPVADAFEPSAFAAEFVQLCMRAAEVGFWHMDIKRANLLYRTSACRPLELSFTDFDPYFCRILSPEVRDKTRHCCIVATIACILGEIRCYDGDSLWQAYAVAMKKAVKTFAGIDIDQIGPYDWCFFLRATNDSFSENEEWKIYQTKPDGTKVLKEWKRSRSYEPNEEWELGQRFRNHLKNYFTYEPFPRSPPRTMPGCFKFVRGKPLFQQIVDHAFKA